MGARRLDQARALDHAAEVLLVQGDPRDRLGGALQFEQGMRHAGDFPDIAGAVEIVEAGVAIGVHPALVFCQMLCRIAPGFAV
jgi:hypothetical protein